MGEIITFAISIFCMTIFAVAFTFLAEKTESLEILAIGMVLLILFLLLSLYVLWDEVGELTECTQTQWGDMLITKTEYRLFDSYAIEEMECGE